MVVRSPVVQHPAIRLAPCGIMGSRFYADVGVQAISMRPSRQRGLTRTATAVSLAGVLALALGTPASAGLLDASSAPSGLLGARTGSSSPAFSPSLSLEALPAIHVQVGELLNVEAEPLPAKVKVGGLPPIETPSLPKAELPSTPPVEAPATPVEVPTVPTTSAPVPVPTGSSTTPSQPTSSSSGSGAHAAGVGASNTSGGSTQASANSTTAAPATTPGAPSARSGAKRHVGTAAVKSHATSARNAAGDTATPATVTDTTAPASSSGAALTRPSGGSAHHKASSSNPLETIGRQIPFPVPVPDWSKPIILVLLLLAILFAVRARLATLRARRLEGQRETMLSDLDDMQAALVPAIPERLGGLAVSVAYEPADGPAAGGDFYDLFELEPGKVAIVLGDVVGHGRPALTQAALTRYTLRAYLQAGLEPRAAVALAGSVLSTPGEKRFATVVVAIHDSASGRLTYACAGHPPPISIGFDAPEPLTVCCSAPICCDLPTGRRQTIVALPPGGRLCFFSDGLPEARIGDDLLGRERLIELTGELGPAASAAELLGRIRDEASSTPDDMVACIVSAAAQIAPAAGGAGPALADQVEELEVDAETLGEPRLGRFLDACRIDPASAASLLAQAGEIARRDGSALLRIERPRAGEPTAVVTAGRSVPDAGPVSAAMSGPGAPALALSTAAVR